jgi:DNA-directed RNA polymerase subunit RPC12/RpoP
MRTPVLICPNCSGIRLRRSKRQSLLEMSKMLMGIYPFRCLDCGIRFWSSVWLLSKLAFAKCPKCLSLELMAWPEKYFRATLLHNLMTTFGAHRYRCPGCRHNFLSFRPRKYGASSLAEKPEIAMEES